MSLHKKTLLIIGLTIVALIVIPCITPPITLQGGASELEEQDARPNAERVSSALSDGLSISIFVLLLLTVFGMVLLLLLELRILSQLAHLSKSVGSIGAGDDLAAQVERAVKDELSSLAGAPNRMQEARPRAHDELELRVQERTIELTKANEALRAELAERKRAEEEKEKIQAQLLQSQKMEAIEILAGGLAHHFNNLMTVVIGYSELLLHNLDDHDPRRRDLEAIRQSGEQAALLTRQLLAFNCKQTLRPQVLDLNATVAEAEKILRSLISEEVELVIVPEPELAWVKADLVQIEQVIVNLATNARDAMPQGGQLTIKIENVTLDEEHCRVIPEARPGQFVCLSVTDTGVGMDEEVLKHLFEPFFSTKEVGQGTGLGLAVVHGIVQQHEGWIDVRSEPGRGSTFKVYLPALSEKPAKEAPLKTANARSL